MYSYAPGRGAVIDFELQFIPIIAGLARLPSAFAADLKRGREATWATEIFAQETLRLRLSLFEMHGA